MGMKCYFQLFKYFILNSQKRIVWNASFNCCSLCKGSICGPMFMLLSQGKCEWGITTKLAKILLYFWKFVLSQFLLLRLFLLCQYRKLENSTKNSNKSSFPLQICSLPRNQIMSYLTSICKEGKKSVCTM